MVARPAALRRPAGAAARPAARPPARPPGAAAAEPRAAGRRAAADRHGPAPPDGRAPPRPDAAADRGDRGAWEAPRLDEWVDVQTSRLRDVDALKAELRSQDLLEVEVLDSGGDRRGTLMAEVIGHGLDEELGISCIFVSPLAAQRREVLDWAIGNLAAPNSLHLCRRKAAEVDVSNAANFILT